MEMPFSSPLAVQPATVAAMKISWFFYGLGLLLLVIVGLISSVHMVARLLVPWPEAVPGVNTGLTRTYLAPGELTDTNAFWYFAAMTNKVAWSGEERERFEREGMTGGPYPGLDALVEQHAGLFALFRTASTQPVAMAEGCFTLECMFPYVGPMLNLARLAVYRAERAAALGDYGEALSTWTAVARNGINVQRAPGLLPHLVGNALLALVHASVVRADRTATLPPETLYALALLLEEIEPLRQPFADTMRAELNMMLNTTEQYANPLDLYVLTGAHPDLWQGLGLLARPVAFLLGSARATTHDHLTAVSSHLLAAMDDRVSPADLDRVIETVSGAATRYRGLAYANDPVARAAFQLLMPSYGTAYKRDLSIGLALEALRAHTHVLWTYRTTGTIPATLDQASATIGRPPVRDSANQRSFIYRPDENGWLLYSIGPDGIDQGGLIEPTAGYLDTHDIGIRFPSLPSP
jgi:hypothetical protein